MPVTVVVGGQYGSEGKGKIAHFLARRMNAVSSVRVGGPNSGHTLVERGRTFMFRQLPSGAAIPQMSCFLPAGAYLDVPVLLREIEEVSINAARLFIHPQAVVVGKSERESEERNDIGTSIGSTLSGTGGAVVNRVERRGAALLAQDCKELVPYLADTTMLLRQQLEDKKRVIIEGTQGFGLSVLHSPHYPFATSRDTTAAGILSEAGLSPIDVDDVVMVIRAYPIRVGGNSGPMKHEVDWDVVTKSSGYPTPIEERTSVTNRIRRVSHFDDSIVRDAIRHNAPTRIALNHLDYVDYDCRKKNRVTWKAAVTIRAIEEGIGRQIDFVGTSPSSVLLMKEIEKPTKGEANEKCP